MARPPSRGSSPKLLHPAPPASLLTPKHSLDGLVEVLLAHCGAGVPGGNQGSLIADGGDVGTCGAGGVSSGSRLPPAQGGFLALLAPCGQPKAAARPPPPAPAGPCPRLTREAWRPSRHPPRQRVSADVRVQPERPEVDSEDGRPAFDVRRA